MPRVNRLTPLADLHAVVLDTETTGLDVAGARLVQMSAVRFEAGRVVHAQTFDRLINPGVPIPPGATVVHRIDDAMVADAARFGAVWPDFLAFLGDAVLVGQSVGFDLAVLLREVARLGERWQPPRFLDTKLLAAALDPQGREFGLDALAARYHVAIADRHRALGDALVTAEVLECMLPLLAEHGIRTLADAEAHSNAQVRIRTRQAAAGWYDATSAPALDAYEAGRETTLLERLDTFPYRHRIEHVVTRAARIVPPSTTLADAVRLMVEDKSRALLAGDPDAMRADGILTQGDVLRAIARDGTSALAARVETVMSAPVATLPRDALLYRALARLQRLGIQHLAVEDAAQRVVGLLSLGDLIANQAADALVLGDELSTARSPRELAAGRAKLADLARHLLSDGVDAHEIAGVVSGELHELLGRAALQAEQRMASQGDGRPPVPYALLALGRNGRGESLLVPRLEHALAFESGTADSFEARWFAAFAEHLDDVLRAAGLATNDGAAAAVQPAWRRSLVDWRGALGEWAGAPESAAGIADRLFDFTFVYGDEGLAGELRDAAQETAAGAPRLIRALAPRRHTAASPSPGVRFDLGATVLEPIESAARALALAGRIPARATVERLSQATTRTGLPAATADDLIETHESALRVVLAQQLADLAAGRTPTYHVDAARLTADDAAGLTDALERLAGVGDIVRYALALV
jgi:CBS domain-containing protein